MSNASSRPGILGHFEQPGPGQEGGLRSGDVDGGVHYRRLSPGVRQDQAQTVDGALKYQLHSFPKL